MAESIMSGRSKEAALVFSALLAVLPAVSHPQPQELPLGQVIEKVTCRADSSQSYALFLPSNYARETKWPILYALDAGARGRLPVERFKEAAETYGYIVAGSNNSRNGPPEIAAAAVRALLGDTRDRLSIDDRRVYFTGFSGGARVAVSVGSSFNGLVAGVIGCGAGFPSRVQPSGSIPFAYFGTAGTEDFNFPEMRQLDRALNSFAIPHRVAIFQGAHDWPPKELCVEAIGWMELQAMRSGIQERRESLIDELLHKGVQKAVSAESSGRMYDALLEYSALARDFNGLRDVTGFQRKVDQLKASKEVQQSIRREREEEESQLRWVARLMGLKESYASDEDRAQAVLQLSQSISDLRRRAASNETSADRLVARRVQGQFLVQLTQEAASYRESKDYAAAVFNLSLAVQIRPDSARLFYNLACANSLSGKKREALAALKSAIDKGFTDITALQTDPDLDGLRKEAAFQRILETLKRE